MTNEQKCQVAAMNASGMTVDEIVLDTKLERQEVEDLIKERNDKKGKRGHPISAQTKQAIIEWYQSGHPVSQTAKKFGVDPKTVKNALGLLSKGKEPVPAPTETSSNENIVQVQNATVSPESQALKGVNVLGILECALSDAYDTDAEIMSLRADSEQAHIIFRYGGKDYALSFGLAF